MGKVVGALIVHSKPMATTQTPFVSPTNNNGQTMLPLTFGLFDMIMLEGQLEKS